MMRTMINSVLALLLLPGGLTMDVSSARAYCSGSGDSCPSSSGALDVFSLPANGVTYLGKATSGAFNGKLGYCYSDNFYPIYVDGSTTLSQQRKNLAVCTPSGNSYDEIHILTYSRWCGSVGITGWAYGGYQLQVRTRGGVDYISGGNGSQQYCLGSGDDVGWGGTGNDDIDGWTGDDLLIGSSGSYDALWGYDGSDILTDSSGTHEVLIGEGGTETCIQDCGGSFYDRYDKLDCDSGAGGTVVGPGNWSTTNSDVWYTSVWDSSTVYDCPEPHASPCYTGYGGCN